MNPMLAATAVTCRLGESVVLQGVDVHVDAGELVALVGPNGAGKSTLLGILSGDLIPDAGQVELAGRSVRQWTVREQSRHRAVLLQQIAVSFPFSAYEVVRMGRAPWAGTEQEDEDETVIASAMDDTDVSQLRDRSFTTLSGGEAGRTALARVLAQATPLLLLDEPTAALDIRHQEAALGVIRRAVRDGMAGVVVLHDLNLAAAYADRIVVLEAGRVAADGPPRDVCRADLLSRVYDHPIDVVDHPISGQPLILPRR